MACGSCKKRQSQYVINTAQSQIVGQPIKRQTGQAQRPVKSPPKPIQRVLGARCPLCHAVMRRISKPNQGEMLQCVNPRCGHIRKNK